MGKLALFDKIVTLAEGKDCMALSPTASRPAGVLAPVIF